MTHKLIARSIFAILVTAFFVTLRYTIFIHTSILFMIGVFFIIALSMFMFVLLVNFIDNTIDWLIDNI